MILLKDLTNLVLMSHLMDRKLTSTPRKNKI